MRHALVLTAALVLSGVGVPAFAEQGPNGGQMEDVAGVDAELKQLFVAWDKAIDAGIDADARRALMERMNAALNRRSYIRNLVAGVHKELTEEC